MEKILEKSGNFVIPEKWEPCYGLFTLPDTDSGTDSDSDSEHDGYIVLCRTCSHCMDSDSDPYLDWDLQLLLYPFLGQIFVSRLGSESVSGNVNKPLNGMATLGICYVFSWSQITCPTRNNRKRLNCEKFGARREVV